MGRHRDMTIDALKGLAVALVVLGHAIYDVAWVYKEGPGLVEIVTGSWVPLSTATNPVLSAVYSFQMPLFAFVGGFVLWRPRPEPALRQLKKRAYGLLVPYFCWALVYYSFDAARGSASSGPLKAAVDAVVGVSTTGPLWYLYALFVCALLLVLLERLPRPRSAIAIAAILAVAASQLPFLRTSLFGLSQTLFILPFFSAGYLAARHRDWFHSRRRGIGMVAGAFFVGLAYLQYPLPVPEMALGNSLDRTLDAVGLRGTFTFLRYGAGLAGAVCVFALYLGLPATWLKPQAWLGRRSLGVFAASSLVGALIVASGVDSWAAVFVLNVTLSALVALALERLPLVSVLLLGPARPGSDQTSVPSEELAKAS